MNMTTIFAFANREARKTDRGFRLWETCTEGSPISPCFKTIDALCAWAEESATIFADKKISAAEWKTALTGKEPAAVRIA